MLSRIADGEAKEARRILKLEEKKGNKKKTLGKRILEEKSLKKLRKTQRHTLKIPEGFKKANEFS